MSIEDKVITVKIVTIIAIIGAIFSATMIYSSLVNRITSIEEAQASNKKISSDITTKINSNDIALAQIQTSLAGIQATLTEVKSKLYR